MTAMIIQPLPILRNTIRHRPDPFAPSSEKDEDDGQRGRDPSPKRTSLPLTSSSPSSSSLPSHVRAQVLESHHHLPSVTASIPYEPILYLPPLLSPLPPDHKHEYSIPTQQTLSSFETRLPDIDLASLVLHQALHRFAPIDEYYASTPYDEAFNWSRLHIAREIEREWYCVVFRSRRNPESSSLSLYQADREAHEEAVKNGGLVMYWYGVPDQTGLNLATCVWQSRRHATKAIGGPKHLAAMKQAANAYEVYELERWVLRKDRGEPGLNLSRWQGGEVGW